jgi:MFS family permease
VAVPASGLYYPAAQGLLPQTVAASQRPQANALDRTGRNAASISGAALGGLLVGLAGPGWGLAIDAGSFAAAGALRVAMHFPLLPPAQASSLLRELREGWNEFASRRWLWMSVAQFSVVVAIAAATVSVLGPLVAHADLGGARSWGFIVAAYSGGAVAGGLVMTRFRPRRILAAAMLPVPAVRRPSAITRLLPPEPPSRVPSPPSSAPGPSWPPAAASSPSSQSSSCSCPRHGT